MNKVTLLQGHVLPVLQSLPDESVQCVVTSPPYWGLRDYGIEAQVWGGDVECGHEWGDEGVVRQRGAAEGAASTLGGRKRVVGEDAQLSITQGQFCRLCNAWRGSYGLEPTIELYIEHTVAIFRELRRVLRKDGVLFLNLGDSYAANRGNGASGIGEKQKTNVGANLGKLICPPGLKPKDLCGIPWRVALALQADGWWLRSDIIWAKSNPMPESCTDRPTTAHEHIFLLTKSAKYFYDAEAVREAGSDNSHGGAPLYGGGPKQEALGQQQGGVLGIPAANNGRNLRTVWEIATHPFPGSHFATFPPELVRRCVAAGTSQEGCCPKCGAPWKRVVEKKGGSIGQSWHDHNADLNLGQRCTLPEAKGAIGRAGTETYSVTTTGWSPTCKCFEDDVILGWEQLDGYKKINLSKVAKETVPVPCTVMDPFSGAGTTALVAAKLGRDAIGIELNPEYVEMSRKRIAGEMGMLVEIEITKGGTR